MRIEDKPKFGKLLAEVMAGYGKPLPDGAMVNVWFNMLTPFDPATIRRAFDAYAAERPDFSPAPNGIAARCKLLDGRPGVEEAWAIALTSRDEADTVIWTTEAAEAFALCRPVLALGDEVGARMAFKDTYTRLVAGARAHGTRAEWVTSVGWDIGKRKLALNRAVKAGFLPAPTAVALLPAPEVEKEPLTDKERAQLRTVLDLLADSAAERERRLERAEQERLGDEMARDIEIQAKVDQRLGQSA